MKRVKKYQILFDESWSVLEHRVNEAINEGWQPVECGFIAKEGGYLQVMVIYLE